MGWQKDNIEDLAEEQGIESGDSWSQQDRLRRIAQQVGMKSFDGLSSKDADELERRLKERRAKNQQNPNNKLNKNSHDGKNKNSKEENKDSKKTSKGNKKDGKFTIKIPLKTKIKLIALLITIPFSAIVLFVSIMGEEFENSSEGSGVGSGSYKYGTTCTNVTVTDTGCSEDGQNCTNEYDGEVTQEDYIAGVVAAEVGDANNLEVYKATAIAARTYYLNNVSKNSCTIKGNSSKQKYMAIDDSPNAELIKQAVEETNGLVLIENEKLSKIKYSTACVTKDDDEYYYIRYGRKSLGKVNFQAIPKSWDNDSSNIYAGELEKLYSEVDKNTENYENKQCPGNNDHGMSKYGAFYLATQENYDYAAIIEYYYGSDKEIAENPMQLKGVNGFVNPIRKINCTSPYGNRTHPVENTEEMHYGIDLSIAGGEPIFAAKDGTIIDVVKDVTAINNCEFGYGNYILIQHEDGTSTLYAHIKYDTIPDSIVVDATVKQGQQIGQVGSTGCSTGNHLHYEVRVNNASVDPADYLDLTDATGTCKN